MTKRYVFFIAIASFLLTVIWIVSNVYHSYATSTIEPLLQVQIQEIDPTFDEETLSGLQERTVIEPSEDAVVNPLVTDDQIATEEAQEESFTIEPEDSLVEDQLIENPVEPTLPVESEDEIQDQEGDGEE